MRNGIGLVLEGGGMRGVYTAGVLDLFMERNLYVPYVIGVSAGACNALSYLSGQIGRNRKVTIDYVDHPRYLGIRNLVREKSLFGMKLIFEDIPLRLEPFDFDAFHRSKQTFVAGVTDCVTGKPAYFRNTPQRDMLAVVRASSSLPFLSPIQYIDGRPYLDGGIADPIPINQSAADGNRKHIVVLTRNRGYRKAPTRSAWLAKVRYAKFPGLVRALETRHEVYNRTLDEISRMEANGEAFVIQPVEPLQVGRYEKNRDRLQALYEQGYRDAARRFDEMLAWMQA